MSEESGKIGPNAAIVTPSFGGSVTVYKVQFDYLGRPSVSIPCQRCQHYGRHSCTLCGDCFGG